MISGCDPSDSPTGTCQYHEYVTKIREETGATGIVLMVVGGNKGPGLVVQCVPEAAILLPMWLTFIAAEIEQGEFSLDPPGSMTPIASA